MRLTLTQLAPIDLTPTDIPSRASNSRLRVELCIFSALLFMNFVKYFVLGGVLGCG